MPEHVDLVNVFRPSADTPAIARQAVEEGWSVREMEARVRGDAPASSTAAPPVSSNACDTATDDAIADIVKQLGLSRPRIINTGIYRTNLHYSVVQVTSDTEKLARLLDLVPKLKLARYRDHGVAVTMGGTLTELAIRDEGPGIAAENLGRFTWIGAILNGRSHPRPEKQPPPGAEPART